MGDERVESRFANESFEIVEEVKPLKSVRQNTLDEGKNKG